MVTLAIAGAVAIAPVISGCGAGSEPQTAAPTQLTEGVNVTIPKDHPGKAQIDVRNMFLLGPRPEMTFGQGSSVPLYATIVNQVKDRPDRLVGVSSADFAQVKITGGAVALPAAKQTGLGSAVRLMGQAAPTPPATGKPSNGKTPKPGAKPSGGAAGGTTPSPGSTPTAGATTPPPAAPSAGATGSDAEGPGASATPSAGVTEATGAPAAPPAPDGKAPLVVLTGLTKPLLGGETVRLRLQFEKAGSVDVSVPVIPQQGEFASYAAVSAGAPAPGATAAPTAGETAPAPEGGTHGSGQPSAPATPEGTPPTGGAGETPEAGATGH
ncbi:MULTISPECIES: copper chaperone PCu(A)C [Actinomadura]|uniref:Copper chaperone PCu(A)C n=1 Tax=Actinomadura yumaensis TaxID=111807 RepID=A0ABW2CH88_9ACTN|nr:copper chaperone PCu(A)C [Actinomadura sp. J1-007]MWK34421.1 hypothetical protein [Actinomadura sp. J1-007]